VFSRLPERLAGLQELASNLWWSWHPEVRMLFRMLDHRIWDESAHDPVAMLTATPQWVLESAAVDAHYLTQYDRVLSRFRDYLGRDSATFAPDPPAAGNSTIAFFSAEYGLHHFMSFYAGGLGFLAGDYLKESSDMGIDLVGIGFMYPKGYFRQRIRDDGWQESLDQVLNCEEAMNFRVLNPDGSQVTVRIPCIEPAMYAAVCRLDVGRIPLFLMDTDIDENDPENRQISEHLYASDREQRLRQEIVLGIGGYHVLTGLGFKPALLHLNEGHAAFALLERIREHVQDGLSFQEASQRVREISLFTTHTPVSAGHDVFPLDLMEKYLADYVPDLGLGWDEFVEMGINPDHPDSGFNMTALAFRLSGRHNAVSRRHGEVTRKMWRGLWPGTPEDKTPIDHVTNGIHVPTWIEPKMELLFAKHLGADWLSDHDSPDLIALIDDIPDEELWNLHVSLKMKFINVVRENARRHWTDEHVNPCQVLAGGTLLDPTVLTVGFARRFATYKRGDLILRDIARVRELVNDPWKPIQIIFAGKAHPHDDEGKLILKRVYAAACDASFGGRIAFIEDYGERLAQYMTHGVDVWLNNPVPPMEACGTSGMKAALNGVPHLSVLDGWWVEGYTGRNGWAIESDPEHPNRDANDAEQIYRLLEHEIVPLYYRLSEDGVPRDWVRVMKESIKSNCARFSARRMVKEYVGKFYDVMIRNKA
jgi:starch phosphorylase